MPAQGVPLPGSGTANSSIASVNLNVSVPSDRCAAAGHRVASGDEQLVYLDGVTIMHCTVCGIRIELAKIPTGDLRPRAKLLVQEIASVDDLVPATVESLRALLDESDEQIQLMGDVVEILRLAVGLLEQKPWK